MEGTPEHIKPPLGLTPHNFWLEQIVAERRSDIHAAILRYLDANRPVNPLWLEEYNQLTTGHWPKAIRNLQNGADPTNS